MRRLHLARPQADGDPGPHPLELVAAAAASLVIAGHEADLCVLDVLQLVGETWDTYTEPHQAAADRITG